MTQRNCGKKVLVLWTLLILLGTADAGAVQATQPSASDPARMIPADALFCIRLNKLTATLGQVDQFLTGISPMGLSMPVQAQLGKLLGAPQPAGINMTGDFAIFGPLPGGEKPDAKRVGVLVPISDFQQFLTNPNVVKPDAQGILKLNIEGNPTVAGIQMGNYVLLTRAADQQALLEAKTWTSAAGTASLAQRLSPDELKRATGSPVWAYANIQVVAKLYGPMLEQKIKEGAKKMQEAQAKGAPMFGSPTAALDLWTSLLHSFLQETQLVSLTIDPSAAAIRLAPLVAGAPNTDLAKILSTSGATPPQPNLAGYLESGAVMDVVATLSPELARAITLKRIDLLTAMVGESMPKEDVARLRKIATDAADALGGSAALSFSADLQNKPPFRVRRVLMIRDKQKLNNVLDQVPKLMNEGAIADLVKKFGLKMQFTLKRNAQTYKDIPIDAGTVVIQPVDANAPQGQMLKNIFGGGLNLRMAIVNNLLLSATAADPDKEIRALIDQAKSGTPGQIPGDVQSALQLIPEAKNASFFGTYNYAGFLRMAMSFMPMPMPTPQTEMPAASAVAFAGTIGGGKLLTDIAVPKQQVEAIIQMVLGMKQQQQQPGQPGTQPPSGPTKPTRKPGET